MGKWAPTGYIDFLTAENLSSNIMKGVDKDGRAFISLKMMQFKETIESKSLGLDISPFVVTLFERYSNSSMWIEGGGLGLALPERTWFGEINDKAFNYFQQVIAGTHPHLKLA